MPFTPPVSVRLRVVHPEPRGADSLDTIIDVNKQLADSVAKIVLSTAWTMSFADCNQRKSSLVRRRENSILHNNSQADTEPLQITFTSRGSVEGDDAAFKQIADLCQQFFKGDGAVLQLKQLVEEQNIFLTPDIGPDADKADMIFAKQFCISMIEASEDTPAFVNMTKIDGSSFKGNVCKWIRGPLRTCIDLNGFLVAFHDLIRELPEPEVAGHVATARNVLSGGEAQTGITPEDEANAHRLVYILRGCARVAPWLRSGYSVVCREAENSDAVLRKAIGDFQEAGTIAINALQQLHDRIVNDPDPTDIQNAIQELNSSIAATSSLHTVCREDVRYGTAVVGLLSTLTAACLAIACGACPPVVAAVGAAGLANVSIRIAAGFMAVASGIGTGVAGTELHKARMMKQDVHYVGSICYQIWLFLSLVNMRAQGIVIDNDERFLKFVDRMAETFQGVKVLENWNKPDYIKGYLSIQTQVYHTALSKSIPAGTPKA